MRSEQGDAASFRQIDGDWRGGLLLLCDHAENTLPQRYGTLGLSAEDLGRHVAYDIGIAAVTERMAKALDAPALLTCFSRLLIDPNRGADDPTLVMRLSDGSVVPGNARIDQAEIDARIRRYYAPYHAAIDAAIDRASQAGKPPVLIAMHSFTPAWKSVPRPWHVAVLWDKDPRLAMPLLDGLRAFGDLTVGDNVPYSGQLKGDTLYQHGTMRGLAHALIEVRQDLIMSEDGQAEWGDRLASVIRAIVHADPCCPRLHALETHGSHTDSSICQPSG